MICGAYQELQYPPERNFALGGEKKRGGGVIGSVDLVADWWNPLQTAARLIWASGDDG